MLRFWVSLLMLVSSFVLCCGGATPAGNAETFAPGLRQPANTDEMRILKLVASLDDGAVENFGDHLKIKVGMSYYAASGRTCRPLDIIGTNENKNFQRHLTCKDKNGKWCFVPAVQQVVSGKSLP